MAGTNTYLNFASNTQEASHFYQTVSGGNSGNHVPIHLEKDTRSETRKRFDA